MLDPDAGRNFLSTLLVAARTSDSISTQRIIEVVHSSLRWREKSQGDSPTAAYPAVTTTSAMITSLDRDIKKMWWYHNH